MKALLILFLFITSLAHGKLKSISKNQFEEVITVIENLYSEQFDQRSAMLIIDGNWDSDMTNAFATRPRPYVWQIDLHGALGREELMTPDVFAFVLCHEIGHHIGGAPRDTLNVWASAEGQADYFAASRCLKRVLTTSSATKWQVRGISPEVKKLCKKNYGSVNQRNTCERIVRAGELFSKIMAQYSGHNVSLITTPEALVVEETINDAYPTAQCRLDTIVAGAICKNNLSESVDEYNVNSGYCSNGSGSRPKCWFNPDMPW